MPSTVASDDENDFPASELDRGVRYHGCRSGLDVVCGRRLALDAHIIDHVLGNFNRHPLGDFNAEFLVLDPNDLADGRHWLEPQYRRV